MNLYEWILLKERLGIDHPEGETHLVLVTQKTATPKKNGCTFRNSNYPSREVYCIFPS